MNTFKLQVAQRGLITLPKALRETHGIQVGDELTLVDLGDVFMLTRQPSKVVALAERMQKELEGRGETLESMLETLKEVRAQYE